MNENIDLREILKGLKGIELWSPICGKCKVKSISASLIHPIECYYTRNDGGISTKFFSKKGLIDEYVEYGECLLFPSKDQRDWSKFERPISKDTPMMCRNKSTLPWTLYKYIGKIDGKHCVEYYSNSVSRGTANFNYMIPFDKFNPNDIEGSLKYNIQK